MHLAEDKLDWVVGFEDECWWSRVRQPNLHSFGEAGEALRLVEESLEKADPMEPKWIHGRRKVVEPEGLLGAYELAERVCSAFGCPHYEHLSIAETVA